ncbi:hypothetical protein ONS96_008604 [Cadophora gregata f. sp. sojae]|nr:hypothetical protein ONS96_008604 [Cadophora gregata f. sp. sojae]
MPTLPSTSLNILNSRNITNSTSDALQVVCAWPVSGQYGPGSRVLYYVLVATCVFARKTEWLRNACLAAALIFPAVAAVHGIVLAAMHVDGAVDMDVFGAFQLCAIGILAAPVTVRVSRTYFYDPGRNAIFLWTGLLLAGLLSLTVEFFRISSTPCLFDNSGNPMPSSPSRFPYDSAPLCGLRCSIEAGPFSPMRRGAVNNIYVIPAPEHLTFHTATLLAAACCIPAVLSLVSMWNKIRKINWIMRWGNGQREEKPDEPIEGTNGATVESMKGVNSLMRRFLSVVEVPVFGAAVLAILILGEMNFFTKQVRYQTEPIASIGQWAPLVGSGLAALGSLYLLLSSDQPELDERGKAIVHHCNCSNHHSSISSPSSPPLSPPAIRRSSSKDGRRSLEEVEIVPSTSGPAVRTQTKRSWTQTDAGNRRKVANVLTNIGNYIGTAAQDRFDDSEFKHGKAVDYPELPGETYRNPGLGLIRREYNQPRDDTRPSRAPSFISISGYEGSIRGVSPQPQSPRSPSSQRPHASTMPSRASTEVQSPASSSSVPLDRGRRPRRDTLEVPSPVHHTSTRNGLPP